LWTGSFAQAEALVGFVRPGVILPDEVSDLFSSDLVELSLATM
jgi:hypothetical protein